MTTTSLTAHSYLVLCNILYWLALTVWVAVLVTAGVAATSTFTSLPNPELGLSLEKFAAYESAEHGRIAAGIVMEPVFAFVDLMQATAGMIVGSMLLLQLTLFKMRWRSLSNLLRVICLVAAGALFLGRAMTVAPEMNQNLRSYWHAAEAGEVEQALAFRDAFDADHRTASTMFKWTLVFLVVAVGASAVALGPAAPHPKSSVLQKPRLLSP